MVAGLANADIIGGVMVTIGGDLSALRATVSQARAVAAGAERDIRIRVPIIADASKLRMEVMAATRLISASASIRLPLLLDLAPALAQIAEVRSAMRMLPAPGGSSGSPIRIDIPSARGGGMALPLMLPGPGGAGANAGPQYLGWGATLAASLRSPKISGIPKFHAYAATGFIAANMINSSVNFEQQQRADINDPGKQFEAIMARRQELMNFPVAGWLVRPFTGDDAGVQASYTQNQLTAGRRAARQSQLMDAVMQGKQIIRSGDVQLAGIGRTSTEQGVIAAHAASANYNEDHEGMMKQAGVRNASGMLARQEAAAIAENDRAVIAEKRDAARELASIQSQANADLLRIAGQGQAAEMTELKAGLDEQEQAVKDAIDKLTAEGASAYRIGLMQSRLTGVQAAGSARVAAVQQANAIASGNIISGSASAVKQSNFRVAGMNISAEVEGINESYRGKIEDAERRYGAGSPESLAIIRERNGKIQEAARNYGLQSGGAIAGFGAAGRISTLQSQNRGREAELAAFDEETVNTQLYGNLPADQRSPYTESRRQQRQALVNNQNRNVGLRDIGLSARAGAAAARGNNENRLADIIEYIGGKKGELLTADAADRGKIAGTQIAELKGIESSILRPNRYATEFDSSREIIGGPTGEAGRETIDVLKAIRDYTKELVNQKQATSYS